MSHPALEIENWVLPEIKVPKFELRYNERSLYMALDIDPVKFYYFLRNRFGNPNIKFESIAKFFPEKIVEFKQWCYLIKSADIQKSKGPVAEWLGRGLQNLVQRFKSARDLNRRKDEPPF